jgi:excisionase family DNA binding protein
VTNVAHVEHVAHEEEKYERGTSLDGARAFAGGSGRLLTVAEVAAVMRVSTMTVYRLIKSGELPAVRIGHNYRIREGEVERYLATRAVEVEGA